MTPYDQKSVSSKVADILIDRPVFSFVVGLLFTVALIPGLKHLQADFSYRIWFRDTDPLLAEFDAFERRFGNDEMIAVVLHSPSGIFDKDSAELMIEMTDQLWHVPEIIRVDSLTNYNWTHSEEDDLMVEPLIPDDMELTEELLSERKAVALGHEVIPGYLVSKDGRTSVIYGQLKPAIGGTPDFEKVIYAARDMVTRFEGRGDHEFFLTGPAAISHTFKEVTQSDLQVMVPILMGAVLLFLFLSFRRISGIILPVIIIVFSIVTTLGFAGWVGIEFNNLTSIVPHILIAIGVADSVHILVTFFQFRKTGLDHREAAHKTIVKNLQPTLLTSVSTAIGFFSFSSAKIVPIVYMGILAGVGTLVAWILTMTLLTPLMTRFTGKVKKDASVSHTEPHPMAIRYTRWLQKYNRAVVAIFAIATVTAIYLALQNEINSNPFKYFAKTVHTRIANEFAEDQIGGMQAIEIVINSGRNDGIKDPAFLTKVEQFQDWIDALPHVSKTIGIVDIIKQTNRSLNGDDQAFYKLPDNQELVAQELFLYTMSLPQGMDLNNRMTLKNDMIRLSAMSDLHDSRTMLLEIEKIEAKAEEIGLDANVTGKMPLYHNMNPYVVSAFTTSISMALVLVSLLMMFALRSFKLGMLSMIPNTVPLIFGGAFMTILGKPIDIGTVLVTSVCLGIAVDDTIHFLSNYNRWRRLGSDKVHAIAHVITHTGPALLVTTTVLVVAFATFAFASFVPNINFGIMTAIVLSTALFTDATLLPAVLLLRRDTVAQTAGVEQAA